MLFFSIYIKGNWDAERLKHLPKVTQLSSDRDGPESWQAEAQVLGFHHDTTSEEDADQR